MNEPRPNYRLPTVYDNGPTYAVWEVTLRCNQQCRFCGTRAGRAGPDELNTDEARELIRQLAEVGVREVSMHGGEAYLRQDLCELVRAIREHGMAATMVTGGRGLTPEVARSLKDVDVTAVSVSIDGPRDVHDALRGFKGSFDGAIAALNHLEAVGISVGANSQVNRENLPHLHALYDALRKHPLYGWQVQLMVPMGRAADEPGLWLEPYHLLELMPVLAELRRRADLDKIPLWPGDNVGYFGPFEDLLRGDRVPDGCSSGCGGGVLAIGIEANGDIKGCSAMASEGFVAGNIRNRSLRSLWDEAAELKLSRCFDPNKLWGYCRECYYADACKAGCIWTANTILGRYGNNPYCHHRALEFLAKGERERLVRVRPAPGKNRDCALFELQVESAPQDWAERMRHRNGIPPKIEQVSRVAAP
ncbi:MAG TPA: radical SAM protein [Polyangiaceae bacterium]|nr:radical SAM protein [Polyangiaceae bacterium]